MIIDKVYTGVSCPMIFMVMRIKMKIIRAIFFQFQFFLILCFPHCNCVSKKDKIVVCKK